MPEQFVSYNPTQVGQGNNIVYQPVDQKYGQLYAAGAKSVAAQKAKAAKDAQEKEYEAKGKFTGSSKFAPEVISEASKEYERRFMENPNASKDRNFINQHKMLGNTLTNQAKSVYEIENNFDKALDIANTDVSGNVSPLLTKLRTNKVINFAKEQAQKQKDPLARLDTYAGVLSDTRFAPQVVPRKSLMKQDDGDIYQKVEWEAPNVIPTNNQDYLRQSSGGKKFVSIKNFNALANQYKNDDAIRNDYRHNDLMSSDKRIETVEDADNYIANKYYKGLDKNKFESDKDYRKSVLEQAYNNQEAAIDKTIEATLKAKLGIDENYNKSVESGNRIIQTPQASSRGKQEQEMGVSVTGSGTIFKNPNEEQNLTNTAVSAKIGTKGLDLSINPSTVSNISLFTEQGTKAPMGSSFNKLTDMHKVYMISDANGNENVPLILYNKETGKRYIGDINKAIEGGLDKYKIVDPNHINKAGEIDPKNHLISYDDFKTKYGRWDIVPGYAMTLSNAEKATTTGGLNETSTAPLTDVSSVVGYIPQSKAGKNQILKMLSEQKIGNTPYAKLDEATGNFEFVGKDLWNNTKLRSVDKTTGKFRQGTTPAKVNIKSRISKY